jgi:hypothetical protein
MKALFLAVFIVFGMMAAEAAQTTEGIQLGELTLAGNACRLGSGQFDVSIEDGKLQIPAASVIRKASSASLARGTCNFILPLQLEPNYRLVLRNLSAMGDLNLAKNTTSRVDLEVFTAGSQGDKLTSTETARKKTRKTFTLKKLGDVLATACGASLNLRGNSSLLLQNGGTSNSALHLIEMDAEIEACP